MPRNPDPITGQKLIELPDIIEDILCSNPSLHDGAILVRITESNDCIISGWSYRLYPPPANQPSAENRGSAYNSSIAMSSVKGVELVLILGSKGISAFSKGVEVNVTA